MGLNELLLRNDWRTSPEGCYVAVNSAGRVIGTVGTPLNGQTFLKINLGVDTVNLL